jgi:hypothetical protein
VPGGPGIRLDGAVTTGNVMSRCGGGAAGGRHVLPARWLPAGCPRLLPAGCVLPEQQLAAAGPGRICEVREPCRAIPQPLTLSSAARYYDSLLAKVISTAPTFRQAAQKMQRALMEFQVRGAVAAGFLLPLRALLRPAPAVCSGRPGIAAGC